MGGETIGAIITAIPVLWGGVMWGHKRYKDIIMKRREEKELIQTMISQLPRLSEQINGLTKEMAPNGGSSFRDQFNNVQEQLTRMEKRQIFSRVTHREVADAIDRMYVEADLDGNWTEVGSKLLNLLGCPAVSLLGRNWTSHLMMGDRENIANEWERCVEERINFNVKTCLIGCDNRMHTVRIDVKVAGEGEVIAGFYGNVVLSN